MKRNAVLVTVGILVAVTVVGLLILPASRSTNRKGADNETDTITETTDQASETQANEDVREMVIEGSEYQFSPSSMSVEEGEPVRVTFQNVGSVVHNFAIDELGIRTQLLAPGEQETVEFVADRTGNFTFYCSVANHQSLGMEGELEVE